MALKEKIIKPQKLQFNINLQEYIEKFKNMIPDWPSFLSAPTVVFNFALQTINISLKFILISILVGQTVHILSSSEKRYINLRHLLIKWIVLLIILLLSQHIRKHTTYDELFVLMCNGFALLMVYPSKFIKNLHLKYFSFSEKKKYDESVDDPSSFEISLITRVLISLTIFSLNISRFMITFIAPQHRKKIEQAMRGVNMVIVQQKYFWKIYDIAWSNSNGDAGMMGDSNRQNSPTKNSIAMMKNSLDKSDSVKNLKNNKTKESVIRAKVSEYIEIQISTMASNIHNRKFTFYRNVDLVYNVESSQLTLISEQDGKSTAHILSEIVTVEQLMVQLICEDQQEPIYVKFKTKKDMQLFLNSIYLQS